MHLNMIAPSPALPGFGFAFPKTFAAWPVWSDSTTKDVKWTPVPKKAAVKLYHRARDFERRSHQPGKHGGAIGRVGLAVLHTLIFDFMNFRSGRLDPSWNAIAAKAGVSYASVGRALKRLKELGILSWLRRCSEGWQDGRFVLEQDTNAYAVLPCSQWRGYTPPAEPPRPESASWGAQPPLPDPLTLAASELAAGGTTRAAVAALESEPGDSLAAALARLGRQLSGGRA